MLCSFRRSTPRGSNRMTQQVTLLPLPQRSQADRVVMVGPAARRRQGARKGDELLVVIELDLVVDESRRRPDRFFLAMLKSEHQLVHRRQIGASGILYGQRDAGPSFEGDLHRQMTGRFMRGCDFDGASGIEIKEKRFPQGLDQRLLRHLCFRIGARGPKDIGIHRKMRMTGPREQKDGFQQRRLAGVVAAGNDVYAAQARDVELPEQAIVADTQVIEHGPGPGRSAIRPRAPAPPRWRAAPRSATSARRRRSPARSSAAGRSRR